MSPAGISPDARAVVRALEALTTQVRRATDALTTTAAQAVVGAATAKQTDYALAPTPTDDAPTTPGTTCSAQYHGPDNPPTACIRAAQHLHPFHTDERSWNWRDDVAMYPVDPGVVKTSAPFPRPAEVIEDERSLREYVQAADEDTMRAARRDSLDILLARLERNGVLSSGEAAMLRQHIEKEISEHDTMRSVAAGNKRHVQTIVPEIDRLAAELEDAEQRATGFLAEREHIRDLLIAENKRANDAIDRERAAEEAAEVQRRRAGIFETELRVLREGLRAIGADPTQIQNLWAQIRLCNRQWRDTKRALRVTRGMLEAEGGDVALVDEMLATVEAAEGRARDAQDAIERVRSLRDPIAAALEQADYRQDMRRGDLADSIMPVIRAALDGTEQPKPGNSEPG